MPGEDTDHGVRQLVLVHGHREARTRVPPERKALVDIAAAVMADEAGGIGITYAGFALTALPHKRLTDDAAWEKTGHRVRLLIEPGAPPEAVPDRPPSSACPTAPTPA